MDPFFVELKTARESQNISLAEISNATLIDVKMLEAIEQGKVNVLPQAYVRAFLREYANMVGLNPDETMNKYESWTRSKDSGATGSQRSSKIIPAVKSEPAQIEKKKNKSDSTGSFPPVVKIVFVLAVLILIDIFLWNVLKKEPVDAVKETPFKDVVKENEERARLTDTDASEKQLAAPAVLPPGIDSLTLVATTTDSVWLQIIIDEKPLVQYFLYPGTKTTWRAKNQFRFPAVGNPRKVKLSVNGTALRIPTTNKNVVRNLSYSRDSARRPSENGKRAR